LSSSGAWITVGRVGRPHGIAGAFVVEEASADPARFATGAVVHAGGVQAKVVESKRAGGGRLVVRLDTPVARGTALEIERSALPVPEPDSYYVADLIGLPVEEEGGRRLGLVRSVEPGVANDVLELDSGTRLPLVDECVRSVDLAGGRIVVAVGFADHG
jgi:16S rRNA processing protein RimM